MSILSFVIQNIITLGRAKPESHQPVYVCVIEKVIQIKK